MNDRQEAMMFVCSTRHHQMSVNSLLCKADTNNVINHEMWPHNNIHNLKSSSIFTSMLDLYTQVGQFSINFVCTWTV